MYIKFFIVLTNVLFICNNVMEPYEFHTFANIVHIEIKLDCPISSHTVHNILIIIKFAKISRDNVIL